MFNTTDVSSHIQTIQNVVVKELLTNKQIMPAHAVEMTTHNYIYYVIKLMLLVTRESRIAFSNNGTLQWGGMQHGHSQHRFDERPMNVRQGEIIKQMVLRHIAIKKLLMQNIGIGNADVSGVLLSVFENLFIQMVGHE